MIEVHVPEYRPVTCPCCGNGRERHPVDSMVRVALDGSGDVTWSWEAYDCGCENRDGVWSNGLRFSNTHVPSIPSWGRTKWVVGTEFRGKPVPDRVTQIRPANLLEVSA